MCAVSIMAVYCSCLTSCFPGVLFRQLLNDLEMALVEPIVSDITSVFTFHIRCVSVASPLFLKVFWASFLITFLSPEIELPIVRHVPFSLSRIVDVQFLLGMVLSVC